MSQHHFVLIHSAVEERDATRVFKELLDVDRRRRDFELKAAVFRQLGDDFRQKLNVLERKINDLLEIDNLPDEQPGKLSNGQLDGLDFCRLARNSLDAVFNAEIPELKKLDLEFWPKQDTAINQTQRLDSEYTC